MTVNTGQELENFRDLLENLRRNLNSDSLKPIRAKAWHHFATLGLPDKKNNAFQSVKLRLLYSQDFSQNTEKKIAFDQIEPWIYPECRGSVLVFINGHYSPQLSNRSDLSSKVEVLPLDIAVLTYGTLLNNYWTKSLKEETDPFAALNASLHPSGAFLYIPPKTMIDAPIQILHLIDGDRPQIFMPRLQVFAGQHSQVNIISSQKSFSNSAYFINQASEWVIDEGAHVSFSQISCETDSRAWHFDACRATLKRDSVFKTVSVSEGSASHRTDYKISLAGENAEASLSGIAMLSKKAESHVQVFMDHQAPNCRSHQLFKGVLNGISRSSFEGKIMVRQAAQKTEAFQLNNHLLLSDNAQAVSKPNLEIFADDVKASHGSTIGQLDAEQLFYMKTRGFSDVLAKNLLVFSFCEEVIEKITLSTMREWLSLRAKNFFSQDDA